jgi:berberine-like enzyme/haloacid dehalogenase-like hydrolase
MSVVQVITRDRRSGGVLSLDPAASPYGRNVPLAVGVEVRRGHSAIIFDIDGTLIDSVDLRAESWVRTFAHFGVQARFEDVAQSTLVKAPINSCRRSFRQGTPSARLSRLKRIKSSFDPDNVFRHTQSVPLT